MARIMTFDVNETLLDLRALDETFVTLFGDAGVRGTWFSLVLRNAMALTITGDESDFVSVAEASLRMVADQQGVDLPPTAMAGIGDAMRNLPPHEDVEHGLTRLGDAGLRVVALTNSPQATAEAQLSNAGIAHYFDRIMSVEPTRKFKPAAAVYEMAAATLGVDTGGLRMIAAHDWDVAGAMRAGCAGAYVTRPGMVENPLYPRPDVVGEDLRIVAERIIDVELG